MRAKKLLSLLLVFAMAVSMLPVSVWATTDNPAAVDDLTYDGTAQTLITAGTKGGTTYTYKIADSKPSDATEFSATLPTGTDAGTYNIWWSEDESTVANDAALQVTIAPKDVTVTAKDVTSVKGVAYTVPTDLAKKLELVTVTGLLAGHELSALTLAATEANKSNDGQTDTLTPSAASVKVTEGGADVSANYNLSSYAAGTISYVDPFTPSFYVNGGEGELTEGTDYTQAGNVITFAAAAATNMTRTGYNLVGFKANNSGDLIAVDGGTYTMTGDTMFYAQWEVAKTITLKYNDGTTADEIITIADPDHVDVNLSTNPTWAGHAFGGWFLDEACTEGKEVTLDNNHHYKTAMTTDLVFYAKWTAQYTVTYKPGDTNVKKASNTAEAAEDKEVTDVPEGEYELIDITSSGADFEYEGYTFKGWKVNGEGDPVEAGEKITLTGDTVLTAVWAKEYTVKFDMNGESAASGSINSPVTVPEGEFEAPACGATVTGKVFIGWLAGKYDDTIYAVGDMIPVTGNITLYAQWDENGFEVTFDTDGGGADTTVGVVSGATVARPETDPTKTGYKFNDWYLVTDGVMASEPYDFTTPVTAAITIKAKWDKAYTVSFFANGGTGSKVALTDQLGTITLPSEKASEEDTAAGKSGFTYDDHVFVGWLADNAGDPIAAGDSYNVTGNVMFFAKWDASWVVNFDGLSGATPATIEAQNIADNGTVTEPAAPTKTGNHFDGWFKGASDTPYVFTTPVTESFTLTAKWTKIDTFTFDLNYTGAPEATKVEALRGAKVTAPTDPEREGWTFGGWFKETGFINEWNFTTDMADGDMTLYAKWTQDEYAVKYNAGVSGATGNTAGTAVTSGTEITLAANGFVNPGYVFVGWMENNDASKVYEAGAKYTVNAKVTFYAKWEKALAVLFDVGECPVEVHGLSKRSGETLVKTEINGNTDPSWAGHKFLGWYTDAALTTEAAFPMTITKDTTLYAKWVETYTVTFDAGDDNAEITVEDSFKTATAGVEYKAPAPIVNTAPAGKAFAGWKISNNGDLIKADDTIEVTENIVLVAQWAKAWTVSFAKGTASTVTPSAAIDNETVPEGDYELPASKWTSAKDGSSDEIAFLGWKVNDAGDTLEAGQTISVTSNIQLVAQWADSANTITVTFDVNGGTEVAPQIIGKGGKAVKPEDPTKLHNEFAGWYSDAACTAEFDFDTAITEDTTIYAKWNAEYEVDFNANGGKGTAVSQWARGQYVVPACTFTRDGYRFNGWNINNSGTIVMPGDDESTESKKVEITVTSDTTLYATWVEVYEVAVTDGTAKLEDGAAATTITAAEGDTVTIKATVPEGQSFDKWTTETEGVTFADETAEETTFVMPGKAVAITATFKSETRTATPENVEATLKVKTGEVTVKWDAVEGATKYAVYRKAKGGEWFLLSKKITETSFVDDGSILPMEANTKYYYCVKAGDPTMDKVWSFHSEVTTASRIITPLDPMTGVSAAVANGKITVSWTDNGAKYFTVYRYSKADGWVRLPAAKKLAAGTTSFVDETAVAGTAYKYCVKSYNGSWSIKSNNTKAVKA